MSHTHTCIVKVGLYEFYRFLLCCRMSRSSGCYSTVGSYGGWGGYAYADINPDPCNVDIQQIQIRSGAVVDAIQVTYYRSVVDLGGGGGGVATPQNDFLSPTH